MFQSKYGAVLSCVIGWEGRSDETLQEREQGRDNTGKKKNSKETPPTKSTHTAGETATPTSNYATTEHAVEPSLTSVQICGLLTLTDAYYSSVMLYCISLLILDYATMVLTFAFMDEILKCDHSTKSCIFRQHHLGMLFITPSWIFPSFRNVDEMTPDCLDH